MMYMGRALAEVLPPKETKAWEQLLEVNITLSDAVKEKNDAEKTTAIEIQEKKAEVSYYRKSWNCNTLMELAMLSSNSSWICWNNSSMKKGSPQEDKEATQRISGIMWCIKTTSARATHQQR